jgi:hypothetical protein
MLGSRADLRTAGLSGDDVLGDYFLPRRQRGETSESAPVRTLLLLF